MGKKITEGEASPEQLKSYIKVANVGVWIAVIAIIILLGGVCVWGIFGKLETTVNAVAICEDGKITAYVNEDDCASLSAGMALKIESECYEIVSVSTELVNVTETGLSEYALYIGNFSSYDEVCSLVAYGDIDSGIYAAKIIVENISPISFLFS